MYRSDLLVGHSQIDYGHMPLLGFQKITIPTRKQYLRIC